MDKTSNRLPSLDLARVIAMLMMVQGHTIYAFADPSLIDTSKWWWDIWSFLRGFTAPVFLTVSGAVHVFANKRDENGKLGRKTIIRRIRTALILFLVGYLLQFPAGSVFDLPYIKHEYWLSFYKVNILQLFGFTLLTALAIFIISKNDKQVRIISFFFALLFAVLTPISNQSDFVTNLPPFFQAYFSFEFGSLFPVIPYSSYFFTGIVFGTILKKIQKENRARFILISSFLIFLTLILISLPFSESSQNLWLMVKSFSRDNPAIVLQREAFVFLGLGIVSLLHMLINRISNIYTALGKRALVIYVLHLMIIYGGLGLRNFFELKTLSIEMAIICALIVETLSISITLLVHFSLNRNKKYIYVWLVLIAIYVLYKFIL